MNGLNLHSGGEEVTYDQLRQIEPPPPTATHHPIAHYRFVDAVKNTLQNYSHSVVEEHHALDHNNARYFGLLTLKSEYGDYTDVCGLRASFDKSYPLGVALGGSVFVCSNLSFYGSQVIKRKLTQHAWRDIHGLLAQIIEPLAVEREKQHNAFNLYKATPLDSRAVHHAVMECYERGVIGLQRIPEIMEQWHEPSHDWGEPTAWRFFNCVTFALAGRVAERPALTNFLHQVLDRVCEKV